MCVKWTSDINFHLMGIQKELIFQNWTSTKDIISLLSLIHSTMTYMPSRHCLQQHPLFLFIYRFTTKAGNKATTADDDKIYSRRQSMLSSDYSPCFQDFNYTVTNELNFI